MAVVEVPLHFYDNFPGNLSGLEPRQVRQVFNTPSIIDLEGRKKQPLFLSFLLHGNETTSFYVLQRLQEFIRKQELPRSLILFVGNVYAMEQNLRFIEGQQDYNRVWLEDQGSKEHRLAHRVKSFAEEKGPLFASIDIHNNTGANPFYACINHLKPSSVYLGSLFSRTLVYFKNPNNAQSVVFSQICPSVTLECGQSGQIEGVEKAFQFILDVMHLDSLEHDQPASDTSIFETVGRIVLKEEFHKDFGFSENGHKLNFPENFERLNFGELLPGNSFASFSALKQPFVVLDNQDNDIFDTYFKIENNELIIKEKVIPSMFTKNIDVIKKDCLGYIMKQVSNF